MTIKNDTESFIQVQLRNITRIREIIANMIQSLPDNPDIHRMEGAPNCFVMSSRNLNPKSFSPFYYDFKLQYKKLIEIIDTANPIDISRTIETILRQGSYLKSGYTYSHTYKFNPTVIKNLAIAYGGPEYLERIALKL